MEFINLSCFGTAVLLLMELYDLCRPIFREDGATRLSDAYR
jgi:hypothetical protein